MGGAKHAMMEEQDRGWGSTSTFVCSACVRDEYLAALIRNKAEETTCDYCEAKFDVPIAAPFDVLTAAVADAIFCYFASPDAAGVPRDEGEWALPTQNTEDVLLGFNLDCDGEVFEAIAATFHNNLWVKCANGHYASPSHSDLLSYSWRDFCETVKHRTRFFFQVPPARFFEDPDEVVPEQLLAEIGRIVANTDLIKSVPKGTPLYRCRLRAASDTWEFNAEQLGAPPGEKCRAGRMNPAGISYLYTATDPATAVAETVSQPPLIAVIATFENNEELRVVDLTDLPDPPSVFDPLLRARREALLFLREFVTTISNPVAKDGGEHIEYVPSQVVSEYFAQMFAFRSAGPLGVDGFFYPSAVLPGGRNLVVFPLARGLRVGFGHMTLKGHCELPLQNWSDLMAILKRG